MVGVVGRVRLPAVRVLRDDILDLPVAGSGLQDARQPGGVPTLRDQFSRRDCTLLVFVRHPRCMFARETVRLARVASDSSPRYPRVVFVHGGTPEAGEAMTDRLWPAVTAISDADGRMSRALEIAPLTMRQRISPSVARRWLTLVRRGCLPGLPLAAGSRRPATLEIGSVGDTGFAVERSRHLARHAADTIAYGHYAPLG